jgi:hypothetical protein
MLKAMVAKLEKAQKDLTKEKARPRPNPERVRRIIYLILEIIGRFQG